MRSYDLMHKDVCAARFDLIDDQVISFSTPGDTDVFLPLSVVNGKTLESWLKSRAIPTTRLSFFDTSIDSFQLMLQNYGLSLTDCYWVKPVELDLDWNKINFYKNDFYADRNLDSFNDTGGLYLTPSASLNGSLKKKWILDNDKRILIKGGTTLQSVSEVIATMIYEKQGIVEYTSYCFNELVLNNSSILGCACEDYASEDLEFIPAIDIINSVKKKQDQSYYQLYVDICKEHGLNSIEDFMSSMLSVDFIIANNDRHLNNFGILRNSDTLEWVKPAPVFDSGNSLFYKSILGSKVPLGKNLIETPVTSFTKTIGTQLKLIKDSKLDVSKLPSDDEYYDILNQDTSLQDFDKEQRIKLLNETKRIFTDFLNGAKVWSYPYQKDMNLF